LNCTNRRIVTLAEWKVVEGAKLEEENEENVGDDLEETLEEILVKEDEGEMLTLGTNHAPESHEHLSLFLTSSEPLLKSPNSEFRAFKEWVQDKSEGSSPPNRIQTNKGNEHERVAKVKRGFLEWMILFQPKFSQT